MQDKVRTVVLAAAYQTEYEFRLPMSLSIGDATGLMRSLLHDVWGLDFGNTGPGELMVVEGVHAGCLLKRTTTVGALVAEGVLVDGMRLALL